jgi:hypothetical protein
MSTSAAARKKKGSTPLALDAAAAPAHTLGHVGFSAPTALSLGRGGSSVPTALSLGRGGGSALTARSLELASCYLNVNRALLAVI